MKRGLGAAGMFAVLLLNLLNSSIAISGAKTGSVLSIEGDVKNYNVDSIASSLINKVSASGDPWLMPMHDLGRTGFSDEMVPILLSGHILWSKNIGPVQVAADGKLFSSFYLLWPDGRSGTICANASNGDIIWQNNNVWGDNRLATGDGCMCLADNKLFIGGFNDGTRALTCLNAEDGSVVWSIPLGLGSDGNAGCPTVFDKRVFVTIWIYYLGPAELRCYSEENGDLLWEQPMPDISYEYLAISGGDLVVGCRNGRVYYFNEINGNLIWNTTILNFIGGVSAYSGRIFVTTIDYYGTANNNVIVCLDSGNGHELWRYVIGNRAKVTPATAYGIVYVGNGEGRFLALDQLTGIRLWEFSGSGVCRTPAIANGKVFLPISGGQATLYCLDASDGAIAWSMTLGSGGGESRYEPLVANRKIYYFINGVEYCIGDVTGPYVGTPIQSPSTDVSSGRSVTVSVSVVDLVTGVYSVTLSYTVDEGANWHELTMIHNPDTDLYDASIPPQPFDTWVQYKIRAYDNAGNVVTNDNGGKYYSYKVTSLAVKIAVILAMFSDNTPIPIRDANFYLEGSNSLVAKLQKYYFDNSYGFVQLIFSFFNETNGAWKYTLDQDRTYYGSGVGNDPSDANNHEDEFATNSIKKADADIDFDSFDVVIAVHSGYDEALKGQGGAQEDMWSQYFDRTLETPDGDYARNWIVLAEMDPMGVLAHEIGHALGTVLKGSPLPDRYGTMGEVGEWDLMGSGGLRVGNTGQRPSHMSAYCKSFLGWINPQVKGYGTYELNSIETLSRDDSQNVLIFYPGGLPVKPGFVYYIIESRTAISSYGQWQNEWWAPDSGIVIYEVTERLLEPDIVNKITIAGHSIEESTLKSGGDFYLDPFALVNFSFVQRGPKLDGYYSEVSVSLWTPIGLIGVKLSQALSQIFPPLLISNLTTAPDLDLHAITPDGKHIGMNYSTGIYENQVPGAVASGDRIGTDEWIFVPNGTDVTYFVSSYDVGEFLKDCPQFQSQFKQLPFNVTYLGFDQSGNLHEYGFETFNMPPNSTTEFQHQIPEFTPSIILPIFVIVTLLAVIIVHRSKRIKKQEFFRRISQL